MTNGRTTSTTVATSAGASPAPASIRMLYIAGAGHSGSTLLSNILGQLHDAFSAGELYYRTMPLCLNVEWQWAIPIVQRALTTVLTWPLLHRYHYPLRVTPA